MRERPTLYAMRMRWHVYCIICGERDDRDISAPTNNKCRIDFAFVLILHVWLVFFFADSEFGILQQNMMNAERLPAIDFCFPLSHNS